MPEPANKETRRIKGLFESGDKTPETTPKPANAEVHEYRDASGKVTAKVELTYGEEVALKTKGAKGRRLEKIIITGDKDGQPVSLDVLSMVNTREVNVVVSESGTSEHAFYIEDELAASVPKLETPTGFAVMLHELGHAEQHGEKRFNTMGLYYGHAKREGADRIPHMKLAELEAIVRDLTDSFPELPPNLAAYELRELARLEPKLREAAVKRDESGREHYRLKVDHRRIESGQLKEIFNQKISLIDAFMEFKDVESDPTALVGKLRELGIDISPEKIDAAQTNVVDVPMESRSASDLLGEEEDALTAPDRSAEKHSLSESDVRSSDDAAHIVFAIRARLSGSAAKQVDWNEKDGQVAVKLNLTVGHGSNQRREVTVRFAVDQETQVLMSKERNALLPAIESQRQLEAEAIAGYQNLEGQRREIMNSSLIGEVVRTPKRLMERDATRRAIKWAKKIKEVTGADLFQMHAVDPKMDLRKHLPAETDEGCESTVVSAIDSGEPPAENTDILEQLRAALHSHGDQSPPVQKLRKAGQL